MEDTDFFKAKKYIPGFGFCETLDVDTLAGIFA